MYCEIHRNAEGSECPADCRPIAAHAERLTARMPLINVLNLFDSQQGPPLSIWRGGHQRSPGRPNGRVMDDLMLFDRVEEQVTA